MLLDHFCFWQNGWIFSLQKNKTSIEKQFFYKKILFIFLTKVWGKRTFTENSNNFLRMLNRKKKNKKQNQLKDYKRGKKLFIKNK
jgi:hypothetical protein